MNISGMISKMKTLVRTATLVLLFGLGNLPLTAHAAEANTGTAQTQKFGLGIVIGEPTGLSGKLWLNRDRAIDFGLSFSFSDYVLIFSDYLFHYPGALGRSSTFTTQLTPYVGIGGVLAYANERNYYKDRHFFGTRRDSLGLGLRVPLGIEWVPGRPPLGVFVELVPGISLIPSTSGIFEGGIGIRYYF